MTSKSFINLSLFLKLLIVYQPEGAIHKGPYTCRLTKVWEMNSCEWMVWEALFSQSSDPSPRSWRVITELLLHREGDALTEHSHSWLREASRSRRAQSLITAVRELTTFSLSRTDPWWGASLFMSTSPCHSFLKPTFMIPTYSPLSVGHMWGCVSDASSDLFCRILITHNHSVNGS